MVDLENIRDSTDQDSGSHPDTISQGHGTISATVSELQASERSSFSSFMNTKDDTNSVRDSEDENGRNEGGPRLTKKWILDFFRKNERLYYRTFELNEKLYFHYKGFDKIENLHLFPELKCLYFEGNGVKKM